MADSSEAADIVATIRGDQFQKSVQLQIKTVPWVMAWIPSLNIRLVSKVQGVWMSVYAVNLF